MFKRRYLQALEPFPLYLVDYDRTVTNNKGETYLINSPECYCYVHMKKLNERLQYSTVVDIGEAFLDIIYIADSLAKNLLFRDALIPMSAMHLLEPNGTTNPVVRRLLNKYKNFAKYYDLCTTVGTNPQSLTSAYYALQELWKAYLDTASNSSLRHLATVFDLNLDLSESNPRYSDGSLVDLDTAKEVLDKVYSSMPTLYDVVYTMNNSWVDNCLVPLMGEDNSEMLDDIIKSAMLLQYNLNRLESVSYEELLNETLRVANCLFRYDLSIHSVLQSVDLSYPTDPTDFQYFKYDEVKEHYRDANFYESIMYAIVSLESKDKWDSEEPEYTLSTAMYGLTEAWHYIMHKFVEDGVLFGASINPDYIEDLPNALMLHCPFKEAVAWYNDL